MELNEIKKLYPEYTGINGPRFIDETGHRYGSLTVLYRSVNNTKDNKAKWICQCDCGNICEATGKEMRQGKIISCGCSKANRLKELKTLDLTGQRFGKLVAIRPTEERRLGKVVWECKCDCGGTHYVVASNLQNGSVKSCGCIKSYGEYLTEQVLKNLKLNYITQYRFSDLVSIKDNKSPLKFDFAILDNSQKLLFLVEFDGEQHEKVYEQWHLPFENDELKNEYCHYNNIPLLRISYKDRQYDKILNIIENYIKEHNYAISKEN